MRSVALVLMALPVAGCTLLSEDSAFVSAPGRFDGYRCQDLQSRYDKAEKRERELVEMMARAESDPAGGLINWFVYASPLAIERGDLERLRQAAMLGKCDLRTGKVIE